MAYRNVNCELSELLGEGNDEFVEPNEAFPVMEPSGEVDRHDTITLKQMIQKREHTGCSSGRARAILVIAESCRHIQSLAHRFWPTGHSLTNHTSPVHSVLSSLLFSSGVAVDALWHGSNAVQTSMVLHHLN